MLKKLNMTLEADKPLNVGEILIVEDSPTQAAMLEHLLKSHNYRTKIVGDGEKAISWLKKHKPHVVISDILMPGIDGFELCRLIKSQT